jgi:hypothetical protein
MNHQHADRQIGEVDNKENAEVHCDKGMPRDHSR